MNISCITGKNKYSSKEEAINKGRVEMMIRKDTKPLYLYRCLICSNYHLTHNPKKIDVKKWKIL